MSSPAHPNRFNLGIFFFQIIILVLPITYLPLFRESIEFPKYLLLYFTAVLSLVIFGIRIIRSRQIALQLSWIDLPVWLIAVTYLISWIFNPLGRWEVWAFPNSIGTVMSLTVIYFFLRQLIPTISIKNIVIPLILSANIIAVAVTVQSLNHILSLDLQAPGFWAIFTSPVVNINGNLIYSTIFLFVSGLFFFQHVIRPRVNTPKSAFLFSLPIWLLIVAIGAGITSIIYNHSSFLLQSYQASWVVTAETYKRPLALVYGIGPGKYELAYLQGKPMWVSQTANWDTAFSQGANHWFTLATEMGLLGLSAFFFLVLRVITLKQKPWELIALVVAFTFLPTQIGLVFLFYIFLMTLASQDRTLIRIPLGMVANPESKIQIAPLALVVGMIVIIASATAGYSGSRIVTGEYYFTQSLRSGDNIQSLTTNLDRAVNANPSMSSYYASRAQILLDIAIAVSRQEDITDEQRSNLVPMIQQAAENAKQAIRLRPSRANWDNLGRVYQSIIGSDEQAYQWTLSSYQNSLLADPYNPATRLRLGQILYQAQAYPMALQQFQSARSLRPEFVAGWYWEANTHKQQNNIELARAAYQRALTLVDPNSEEYTIISQDLESLQSQIPPLPTQPEPELNTPLELPQETGPADLPSPVLPTPEEEEPTPTPTAEPESIEPEEPEAVDEGESVSPTPTANPTP